MNTKNETEQNITEQKHSKRKYIIAAVCFVLFLAIALVVAALQWEPKPDPGSEMIIRIAAANQLRPQNQLHSQTRIEKEPNDLNDQDFAKLTKLSLIPGMGPAFSIPWGELYDIKLLEKFTNLQELNLNSIKYPESKIPKWMKILARFGAFDLDKRFAIDLSPLKNLSSLKKLRLNNGQINDITPLKNLNNLEELYIEYCPNITDKQVEELQKALPNCKIYK